MKIYKKYKLLDPNRRKSVKREIKLMEKMKHPNIIRLYEVIDTSKYVILVMEYVGGGSLHGYLKSKPNRRLEESDAKRIFRQVLEARVVFGTIIINQKYRSTIKSKLWLYMK